MFHLTLETVCEKCTIIEAREIKKLQGHTACKLWTQDSNIDFQVPVILKQFIFSVSTNYKHSWVQGIQKNASKTIFTVQTLIIRESLPACIRPHSYNKPIKKNITTTYWTLILPLVGFAGGSVQFSSVTQACPTLCDPMDCSMPGFPVHHQLLELTQTHVHWVGDAIQPSHPLLSPSPPASGKEFTCQCRSFRRCGFDPCVRKIPCSRKWQPVLVLLPEKPHGQRSLAG